MNVRCIRMRLRSVYRGTAGLGRDFSPVPALRSTSIEGGTVMHVQLPARLRARAALASAMMLAAFAMPGTAPVSASSHREAPFIATQPQTDATDFYMFCSYEPGRDGYVTLVANYLPIQSTYGGPNFFKLDPNALYEIHVSNDGGAAENITFSFKFQNTLDDNKLMVGGKQVSIPLVQNASADVSTPNSPALNTHEKYTVDVIRGNRRTGVKQSVANTTSGGARIRSSSTWARRSTWSTSSTRRSS